MYFIDTYGPIYIFQHYINIYVIVLTILTIYKEKKHFIPICPWKSVKKDSSKTHYYGE